MITITNNLFIHTIPQKQNAKVHFRIQYVIVIEITPGHNYRWHATTKNYACKPGYLAVDDSAGPR